MYCIGFTENTCFTKPTKPVLVEHVCSVALCYFFNKTAAIVTKLPNHTSLISFPDLILLMGKYFELLLDVGNVSAMNNI